MDIICRPFSSHIGIHSKCFVDFYLIFLPEAVWFLLILGESLHRKARFKAHIPVSITLQILLIFLVYFVALSLILFYADVTLVSGAEVAGYVMMCIQWLNILNTYQTNYRDSHWANSCLKTVKIFLIFEVFHAVLMTYTFISNYRREFEMHQGEPHMINPVLYWIEFLPWLLYFFFFLILVINKANYKKPSSYAAIHNEDLSYGINLEPPKESKQKLEIEINPYEKASLFSRLLLSWVYPKLKLGCSRPLQESDASALRKQESSTHLYESLEPYLKEYLSNQNDKRALFKAIYHTFKSEIIWNSFLAITATIMDFSGPVFILFLESFINGNGPYWRGIALVFYMMICKFIQAITNAQYKFEVQLLGSHLKGSVSSHIYFKSLKVSKLQISNSSSSPFSYAQVVNLMQVDLERICTNIPTSMRAVVWPFQWGIGIFLLYYTAGLLAASASLVLMIGMFLLNVFLFKRMAAIQKVVMEKKDVRLKYCNELLNCMKVLKLYNWETKVGERVTESREAEMKLQSKYLYILLVTIALNWGSRNYLTIAIVDTMALVGAVLTPGKVFAAIAVIGILNLSIRQVPDIINNFLQMQISLKRIQDYLVSSEIVSYNSKEKAYLKPNAMVAIQDCSFAWTYQSPEQPTNSEMIDRPVALKNINLEINIGEFVAIVGRVASGKSSLLQALINNMILIKETDSSYMFLQGRVSYASQEPWIQNTTIKNNILFGSYYDEDKYHAVIDACQLGPDLDILPGGDLTEIGEKGINLSGGQKARVSIARAAYADTDVVLLDDPLSAVDAHVGREIFHRCMRRYMNGKTRILVTNGQQFLPYVDRIVVMENGQIVEQGTYQQLISSDSFFKENILVSLTVDIEESSIQQAPEEIKKTLVKTTQRNIIEAEDRAVGRVSWSIYSTYVHYLGGWIVIFLAFLFMTLWMANRMYTDIFLSEWTDASSQDQEDNFTYYIVIFSVTAFTVNLFIFVRLYISTSAGIRAANTLFSKQLLALLDAPVNKFYDVTPSGRILNRLSKDQSVIDGQLIMATNGMIGQVFSVISILIICAYVVPWVLVIVPLSVFLSYKIQRIYLSSSRELMRLESISRSPIVQNFSETISGSETIRAYNYEEMFINKNTQLLDKNLSIYFDLKATNAWLSINLELVSDLLLCVSALVIVISRGDISPGYAGLSLSHAVSVPDNIYWMIFLTATLETAMVSVERAHSLALTPHEAARKRFDDDTLYSSNWPREGGIKFENYQMKYRDDTDIVLRGVDAIINPGERIGIVGRTGSGKSSLCLSLFRIVEPYSGKIYIDGVDLTEIGLDILRQKLSVIPQDPVLFKGTVRYNLDPFQESNDEELKETLSVLFVNEDPKEMLDREVQDGGSNFSVGQKQLICIARAMIRKSKILFLDEATASLDYKTDELIQMIIQDKFEGRTVITIAHRINTIMNYDRILVMDNGRVAEFDTPENLLKKQGIFYELVSAYKT